MPAGCPAQTDSMRHPLMASFARIGIDLPLRGPVIALGLIRRGAIVRAAIPSPMGHGSAHMNRAAFLDSDLVDMEMVRDCRRCGKSETNQADRQKQNLHSEPPIVAL